MADTTNEKLFETGKAKFRSGSYAEAQEIFNSLFMADPGMPHVYYYRTLTKMCLADPDTDVPDELNSSVIMEFDKILGESDLNKKTADLIDGFEAALQTFLVYKAYYDKLLEEHKMLRLKAHLAYTGADDEDEKKNFEQQMRSEDNICTNATNRIGRYRSVLLDEPGNRTAGNATLEQSYPEISLNFVSTAEKVCGYATNGNDSSLGRMCERIRKARNRKYWNDHKEEYDSLTAEKTRLTVHVKSVIEQEMQQQRAIMDEAEKEIGDTKADRKGSKFFSKERKAFNDRISAQKERLRAAKQALSKLEKGDCPTCRDELTRIRNIDEELTMQR